jgi:hypothetical protein
MTETLYHIKLKVLTYPPHSLDLALSSYHLFRSLNEAYRVEDACAIMKTRKPCRLG